MHEHGTLGLGAAGLREAASLGRLHRLDELLPARVLPCTDTAWLLLLARLLALGLGGRGG